MTVTSRLVAPAGLALAALMLAAAPVGLGGAGITRHAALAQTSADKHGEDTGVLDNGGSQDRNAGSPDSGRDNAANDPGHASGNGSDSSSGSGSDSGKSGSDAGSHDGAGNSGSHDGGNDR
jgi:hypothetical protein